jgi:hypothetical protein
MLPSPTGVFSVGRLSLEFVDPDRPELFSDDPNAHRELVLWLWYPARSDSTAERADYLPAEWAPNAAFLGLEVAGARTHAVSDAPMAEEGPTIRS